MRPSRLAGVLGIAYVILVVVNIAGFNGGNPPDPHATAQQIAATYSAHRVGYMLGPFLDSFGSLLLIGFFYQLARRLEPDGGILSTLVIAGAILATALDLLWAAALGTAVQLAVLNADAESVKAMVYVSQGILWIIGTPLAVALIALGYLAVVSRGLPGWIGWTALVIGVLAVLAVIAAAVTSSASGITFGAYILSLLWTLATAIYLIARPDVAKPALVS
jgi:hypothetical protein